jgi:hypothetical protein
MLPRYTRDWRFYMKMKIWIHRDPQNMGTTIRRANGERGVFIIYNPLQWRKERVRDTFCFGVKANLSQNHMLEINYSELEARHGPPQFNG